MGLIIPVSYLAKVLPSDATDTNSEQTNAVTEASAFVDTWTSKHYEPWDDYTGTSTLNAPREICYITTQLAKHMYYMNIGSTQRDGAEDVDHEARIEYYRNLLTNIDVKPTEHTLTINLDDDGYQLIARNKNILTCRGYIGPIAENSSSSSDGTEDSDVVWNLGVHYFIRRGSSIDTQEYWNDGWYVDGTTYKDSLSGVLHYWRSYRNDGKDYMATYKTGWDKISG